MTVKCQQRLTQCYRPAVCDCVMTSELTRLLSLDLTTEMAIIDAGQSADMVVDALPPPVVTVTSGVDESEPAWNKTPSCMRTQRHVMLHRRSQFVVAFLVDDVVSGDRDAALANLHRDGVERSQGLREVLSELLIMSALDGDMGVISRLVNCEYVHVDVADSRGNTALHSASVSCPFHAFPLFHCYCISSSVEFRYSLEEIVPM